MGFKFLRQIPVKCTVTKYEKNTGEKSNFHFSSSFDLELTGRALPPWKTKFFERFPSKTKIERHSETLRKFCYHHHVEDPTKVVALDPLPNNSMGLAKMQTLV